MVLYARSFEHTVQKFDRASTVALFSICITVTTATATATTATAVASTWIAYVHRLLQTAWMHISIVFRQYSNCLDEVSLSKNVWLHARSKIKLESSPETRVSGRVEVICINKCVRRLLIARRTTVRWSNKWAVSDVTRFLRRRLQRSCWDAALNGLKKICPSPWKEKNKKI